MDVDDDAFLSRIEHAARCGLYIKADERARVVSIAAAGNEQYVKDLGLPTTHGTRVWRDCSRFLRFRRRSKKERT